MITKANDKQNLLFIDENYDETPNKSMNTAEQRK